jgi:hypothetical protein
MVADPAASEAARVERQTVEVVAAVRMAGEEPPAEAIGLLPSVLSGEMTADEATRIAFAEIDKRYGVTRSPQH